ncbi:MAG: preprotein translocase subunit SecG [Crocinitomicaceae bacterium]|nr:preprotein translocase subunit SecG [Crocinitomicaceae bacterium]
MTLFSIIIVIASILLIFVVFVQNPKGGGLSSDFGAAHQLGGVQKTNDFIDKTTWGLAGLIAVLSIVLTVMNKSPEAISSQPAPTEQGTGENPL